MILDQGRSAVTQSALLFSNVHTPIIFDRMAEIQYICDVLIDFSIQASIVRTCVSDLEIKLRTADCLDKVIRGEYSRLGLFEPYERVAISTETFASAVQSK